MQEFTLILVTKTNESHDYVVSAFTLEAAIDKLLDKVSYDVCGIHTDDECIIF
jgi:hypothetical protein